MLKISFVLPSSALASFIFTTFGRPRFRGLAGANKDVLGCGVRSLLLGGFVCKTGFFLGRPRFLGFVAAAGRAVAAANKDVLGCGVFSLLLGGFVCKTGFFLGRPRFLGFVVAAAAVAAAFVVFRRPPRLDLGGSSLPAGGTGDSTGLSLLEAMGVKWMLRGGCAGKDVVLAGGSSALPAHRSG